MTYQDVIGQATGERPSEAVGRFLEQYLLPGEPVLAALRGVHRQRPVWVVVTPGIATVLRDGEPVVVDGAAAPSDGIELHAGGGRRHHELRAVLGSRQVTVSGAAGPRLPPFLAAVDDVLASLDGGFPPQVAGVLRGLDIGSVRPAAAGRRPRLLVSDVFHAVAGALTDPAELSFHLALVLIACADDDRARSGRRETVVAAVTGDHRTAVGDFAAVRSLRAARNGGGDTAAWRGIVTALATAVGASASLLAPDSPQARLTLHETAAALRDVADEVGPTPEAATARPAADARTEPDVLLDTLERLHRLRESGALVEAEYDVLKRQALGR